MFQALCRGYFRRHALLAFVFLKFSRYAFSPTVCARFCWPSTKFKVWYSVSSPASCCSKKHPFFKPLSFILLRCSKAYAQWLTISHEAHLPQSSGYMHGPQVTWHALLPGCRSTFMSSPQRQHLFSHVSCSTIFILTPDK